MADERVKLIFEGVDKASKVAGKIDKRITAMSKKMGDVSKRQANIEKLNKQRIDASVKADGARRDSWKKTIATGAVLAGALVAVGVAAKKAFDLGEQGAVVKQTAESFEFLLDKVGAAPDLLEQLDAAAGGTISKFETMTSTATLLAGLTGEVATSFADATPELLKIAKAANKLNPALGTTTFLYESLARGIKRSSPLILDNLGLTIKVGAANEAMAEKLGIAVEALSAEEKQQALLNDTMRAGAVLIDQVGGNVDSATDAYSRLSAEGVDASNRLKEAWSDFIQPTVEATADLLGEGNKVAENFDLVEQAVERGLVPMEVYADLVGRIGTSLISTGAGAEEAKKELAELAEELEGKFTPAEQMAAEAAAELARKIRGIPPIPDLATPVEEVGTALEEAAEFQGLFNEGLLAGAESAALAREANLLYKLATEDLTAAQRKSLIAEKEELDRLDELVALRIDGNLSLEKYVAITADGVVTEGELAGAIATTNVQFREEEEAAEAVRLELEKMDGKTFNTSLHVKISQSGQLPSIVSKTLAVQAFAHGGDFRAGQPILVGDEGAEVIVPKSAGTVIPNNQLGGGGSGGFSDDQMFALSAMFDDQADRIVAGFLAAVEQVVT